MSASRIFVWLAAALAAATALGGCGRQAPNNVPGVYDSDGKPVLTTRQPPVKDRHFVLDPLIQ